MGALVVPMSHSGHLWTKMWYVFYFKNSDGKFLTEGKLISVKSWS